MIVCQGADLPVSAMPPTPCGRLCPNNYRYAGCGNLARPVRGGGAEKCISWMDCISYGERGAPI
jgi:hypothetical protein